MTEFDTPAEQRRQRDWRCQGKKYQESKNGATGMLHLCVLPKYHFPPCFCWCERNFTPDDPQPVQTSFLGLSERLYPRRGGDDPAA